MKFDSSIETSFSFITNRKSAWNEGSLKMEICYWLNHIEEYLHDQIKMTEWTWPKFGEHDRKIDNDEH